MYYIVNSVAINTDLKNIVNMWMGDQSNSIDESYASGANIPVSKTLLAGTVTTQIPNNNP